VLYRNKPTADARSISMTASLEVLPRAFRNDNRPCDLEQCCSIPQGGLWISLVLISGSDKQTNAITSQYSRSVLSQVTGKGKGNFHSITGHVVSGVM
jgi:hypothetical protein